MYRAQKLDTCFGFHTLQLSANTDPNQAEKAKLLQEAQEQENALRAKIEREKAELEKQLLQNKLAEENKIREEKRKAEKELKKKNEEERAKEVPCV